MQPTKDKLDNLKGQYYSKLKLYSSIFSVESNFPNSLKFLVLLNTKIQLSYHKLSIERNKCTRPKTSGDKRTCKFAMT